MPLMEIALTAPIHCNSRMGNASIPIAKFLQESYVLHARSAIHLMNSLKSVCIRIPIVKGSWIQATASNV